MKFFRYTLLCSFLILLSCEDILDSVPLSFSIDHTFNIQSETLLDEEAEVILSDFDHIYSISNNQEISEYLEAGGEIETVEIKRIRIQYQNFEGYENAYVNEANIEVEVNSNGGRRFLEIAHDGSTIHEDDFNNRLYVIDQGFSDINNYITNSNEIRFGYFGRANGNPVEFDAEVTIDVVVTIQPNIE